MEETGKIKPGCLKLKILEKNLTGNFWGLPDGRKVIAANRLIG